MEWRVQLHPSNLSRGCSNSMLYPQSCHDKVCCTVCLTCIFFSMAYLAISHLVLSVSSPCLHQVTYTYTCMFCMCNCNDSQPKSVHWLNRHAVNIFYKLLSCYVPLIGVWVHTFCMSTDPLYTKGTLEDKPIKADSKAKICGHLKLESSLTCFRVLASLGLFITCKMVAQELHHVGVKAVASTESSSLLMTTLKKLCSDAEIEKLL